MDPTEAIAQLDLSLLAAGQDITLTRIVGLPPGPSTVTCRCRPKNGDTIVSDGPFGKSQGTFMLILSPTEITTAGWPGGPSVGSVDPRVPINQDVVIMNGHRRTVQVARGIYMDNVLVRIEALVVG